MNDVNISEGLKWSGRIRLYEVRDGREYLVLDTPNLITDAGKNLIATALSTGIVSVTDVGIRQVAWSFTATTPNAAHTTLASEAARKEVTKQLAGSTGQYITRCYLAPWEAIGTIETVAWFAGPTANGSPNTGVMVAEAALHFVKAATTALIIERTDSFA